jgi:hypothetical protein
MFSVDAAYDEEGTNRRYRGIIMENNKITGFLYSETEEEFYQVEGNVERENGVIDKLNLEDSEDGNMINWRLEPSSSDNNDPTDSLYGTYSDGEIEVTLDKPGVGPFSDDGSMNKAC